MAAVIGLVGPKGAGKGTFCRFLAKIAEGYDSRIYVERFSSGEFLMGTLNNWYIPASRVNLQKLAVLMEKAFGPGAITNAVKKDIESHLENFPPPHLPVAVFDGVRWPSDVEMIRSFPKNFLVYVTAPADSRYKRARGRTEEKAGESSVDYEQFLKEESADTETEIAKLGQQADFKIETTGTLRDHKEQVKIFWEKYLKPALTK